MKGGTLGPYQIDRELGAGGMGTVYAATVIAAAGELVPGTPVAIKVVHPHLLQTPGFFRRFLREARIGAELEHENVVRTFLADALAHDDQTHHFLVMEHVEGQTLSALRTELGIVPEELCRHVAREICKGLSAIHAAGVVHRDLKPENVLITPEHEIKIMDLGVAQLTDEAIRLSQTGLFVGSVDYASPEQFQGDEVDARADLHALGLVLYELSAGRHPFRADDFRAVMHRVCSEEPRPLGHVNPQLSPFFEEVVHTLLAKAADDRFASAEELLVVLEHGEDGPWWRARARSIRAETRRPLRRIQIPRETAVHGRAAEVERLVDDFRHATRGEGRIVLLEGEAGIGKSRLLDELLVRLRAGGEELHFLYGSYPPGGAATAAGAFATAYREHFGDDGAARYLEPTPLLVPAFDALLRGDATPTGAVPLTKASLQTCFVHATRGLAAERTTIVAIDDLHFAPEAGLALFSALAMAVTESRVLLIGSTRRGLTQRWISGVTRLPHARHETLERLGPKDLAALLEDAFGSKRLADELGMQIGRMSDGNPFFVFELLEGLRDSRIIERSEDGSWVSTRRVTDLRLPSSLLDLVNARVADLEPDERDLLDMAACCGYLFDPGLVAEALGLPRIQALRSFGRIERAHRLVRSSGRAMIFDHHQIQESLYDGIHAQLREEYHGALADALATRVRHHGTPPEQVDGARCVELCEHFLRGGRRTDARPYLDPAVTHLRRGHLHEQSADLLRRALDTPGLLDGRDRAEALLHLAGNLDVLARRDDQVAVCREAETLALESDDAAIAQRAAVALGTALMRVSEHDAAEAALQRALAAALDAGDRRAEGTTLGVLGHLCRARGRLDEAGALHARHLAIARTTGDARGESHASGNLGNVAYLQGRLEEAREHHERDLELARAAGDRRSETIATGNLAAILYTEGLLDEARALFEDQLRLARQIGDRVSEARATGNLGAILLAQGRLSAAQEQFAADLALAREIGDRVSECFALQSLGTVSRRMGDPSSACDLLQQAVDRARERGLGDRAARALAALGSARQASGDVAEAHRLLTDARERFREMGAREHEASTLVRLAELHARQGDDDAAAQALDTARARSGADATPDLALRIAVCQARWLGTDDDGVAALLDAHGDACGDEVLLEAQLATWQLHGDRDALDRAKREVDELLRNAPPSRRTAMRENVELIRDVLAAWEEHGGGPAAISESPTRSG